MIYLDNGATSFHKPQSVYRAVERAIRTCANPGRGGYGAAMKASEEIYGCREAAAALFDCQPEQVALTTSCTHGLNIAIRPLHALGAEITVAGRKLFDWKDTLESFRKALDQKPDAVVFTHVSNVFGYILPVEELARMCRDRGIPFVMDAAQSAGSIPISLEKLGAEFIAMPGHKGLLGPQGTGLLLCRKDASPLLYGGTGSASIQQDMPDRREPGTLNVPGYAGLAEGLRYIRRVGEKSIFCREHRELLRAVRGLEKLGMQVFTGEHQAGTVSFLPGMDCEEAAEKLAKMGFALRAGLHCAPYAHESAGTLESGTVRLSFGHDAIPSQTEAFLRAASKLLPGKA